MSPTEILVGLVGVLGSMSVAYLAYKRGSEADEAAHESAAITQVYAGYGGLLQSLQFDNADLRRRLETAEQRAHDAEAKSLVLLARLGL